MNFSATVRRREIKLNQLKFTGILSYPHRVPCQEQLRKRNMSALFEMAPYGQEMTVEAKELILNLIKKVVRTEKTAEITGKNRKTVSKFLSKFSSTGSIENRDRTERRKKSTLQADRRLFRMVRTNKRQTLNDLT